MMRRSTTNRLVSAVLLGLSLLSSTASTTQKPAPNPWIGKRIITRYGTVLRVGGQVVDDEKRSVNLALSGRDRRAFRIYRVQQTKGPWLWLVAEVEGVSGWVKIGDVIPFDQAIDNFTAEIRANPGSSENYSNRGFVRREKGEYDIAIADYNEAIRLDPKDASVYHNRGNAWSDKKEFDKAIADFTEAIRLDPKLVLAYYNRGNAWSDKKEFDKAIADFTEAIRLDPKLALAYNNRGIAWKAKKEFDKAIADYGEAIRLDPKDAWAYNNRGNASGAKKERDKAIADYTEAIRLDPKDAAAYNNRGWAWHAKQEFGKAIADYGEAIRVDPKLASAYSNRAWLWATCPDTKFRDGKRAVKSATRGCELSEWKGAKNIGMLAAACAEAGDFDSAVKWQEKANGMYEDSESKEKGRTRLDLYRAKKPYRETSL
jgi:tetratricopeptide (TPR) repeat protein